MDTILFFTHYTLLLAFGLVLSAAFSGIRFSGKNLGILAGLFGLCGLAQLTVFLIWDEKTVWMLYPLIAHLLIILVLTLYYRKRIATALAAVASAYLCCQPAKWLGLLTRALTGSAMAEQCIRILVLIVTALAVIRYLAATVSHIYNRKGRSVWIFGIIPLVYYLFDYIAGIYSDLWKRHAEIATEFLPFLLCLGHLLFCVLYFKEYIQKADAEQKEQLIRITAEQQAREIETIRRAEYEMRLLRHDMRLFLNSLSMCVEEGDMQTIREMIAGLSRKVETSSLKRYCENDTLNYLISDYAAQCREQHTDFSVQVELTGQLPEPILLATILANALDNALNAQRGLPEEERNIRLMLKTSNGKTLLSVKNPYLKKPVFADGLPVSNRKGHGYGAQSIRYATERLGGNCQFTLEENRFVLRVVI